MYSKLLWCGVSLLLNKLKPSYISKAKILELDIVESKAKNNKYKYTFNLNNNRFVCEYTFNSNVCVTGTVELKDIKNNTAWTFATERTATAIKCSISAVDFEEFYTCYDRCFINIGVEEDKVSDISTLEVIELKSNKFKLNHVNMGVSETCDITNIFIKTLFAATAAMDYDVTKCYDSIFIGHNNVNITLFKHSNRRVICLTTPREHTQDTNIVQLINSEFNQIIHYDNPHNEGSIIEEYVLNDKDGPILRRNYNCMYNDTLNEVVVNDMVFSVDIQGRDIFFYKK